MKDVIIYQDETTQEVCEAAAFRIRRLIKHTVESVAEIGRELAGVKDRLDHGQWLPWLEVNFGWTAETARRYSLLARAVDGDPRVLRFRSIEAALQYPLLEAPIQDAVMVREAFTWSGFKRVVWDATMRAHLIDSDLDYDRRYGAVLNAIEDAVDDPMLAPVAAALYEENREEFARLSAREPAEMDREVAPFRDADPDRPVVNLVMETGRYAIFRWNDDGWAFHAHVPQSLTMGGSLLFAAPETADGPASRAWQNAGLDALCKFYGVATLYGEAL